jgi:putative peptide modification system cyclase
MSAAPDTLVHAPARHDAPVPLLRTLVLCDLADSTALVERLGDLRAAELFRRHDRLARSLIHQFGGREIDKTDGFLLMFDRPIEAVAFSLAYQRGLRELADAEGKAPLRARVGVHVGDVVAWDNAPEDIAKGAKPFEVEGLVKPTTSRLMQLALPGQILLSGVAYQLAHRSQDELGDRAETALWRTHGRYRFKGLPDPVAVFEVGEKDIAPLKPPPWSGKAHREVPFWRRPATMVAEFVVLLALVALPVWYLVRPETAIAFAQRDWVVVGDLKNLTDETSFDDSLETAFRIGLEQSRYVNVLSDLKTRNTVALMKRDPEHTEVDRAIGSEVAIRNGVRALILPTVAEIGGRLRVTAEVIDPSTQTTVWSESADGSGADSVLPSLDAVNRKLRVRLGEALATVSSESQPLDKVATDNLDALRAYSLGKHAHALGNAREAISFYRQAIKLDASFALAHAAIGQTLSDMGDPAAALVEYKLAAEAPGRLAPRDVLYVEALQASLGPVGPALEKWKQLTALYPDFFPGDGAYAMSLYEQANDYPGAIDAATKSASPKNAHLITSKHLLGILYLGTERYKDSVDAFAATDGFAVTQFHASAFAAQRDFAKAVAVLGGANAASVGSLGRRIFEGVLDVDQGRIDAAIRRFDAIRTDERDLAGRDERRLRAVVASLKPLLAPTKLSELADYAAIAQRAAATDKGDFDDAQFHALAAAYFAARQGDVRLANESLAAAAPEAQDAALYPILSSIRRVADAELARANGHPDQAVSILKGLVNGRELYVTHVALMDAHAAAGDNAAALDEARWLAAHRGRAYTEYGSEWALVPFDVAQSNLALLRAAELESALGRKADARRDLDAFRRNWGEALSAGPFAVRVDRVDAATR